MFSTTTDLHHVFIIAVWSVLLDVDWIRVNLDTFYSVKFTWNLCQLTWIYPVSATSITHQMSCTRSVWRWRCCIKMCGAKQIIIAYRKSNNFLIILKMYYYTYTFVPGMDILYNLFWVILNNKMFLSDGFPFLLYHFI